MEKNILVLGLGAYAFGKERRAILTFKHMSKIKPYFAVSKWGDGSVVRLLRSEGQAFFYAPFGYLGRAKPLWTLVAVAHMPSLWYRIVRECIRKKCRVIVFLCLASFTSAFLPTILLKLICRVRIVFYMGDIPKESFLYHVLGWFINKLSGRVIANAESVKRGLTKIGIREEKIKVVYNGKTLRNFRKFSKMNFRDKFGFSMGDVVVAFLGQLSPNKGVEDFIKAVVEVLNCHSNCRFIIIGDATALFKDFEKRLHDSVQALGLTNLIIFTGRISDVESIYEGIDMVVVPSRHEDPAPNVIIEAMAAGIPVVATRVGGTPELIEDAVTGFLIERNKPDQIAEKVLRLVRDPILREKMGEAGKKRASLMFDIEKNAELIERIILA